MKLIKPRRLGCLQKSYSFEHKHWFVSAPLVFFDMKVPGIGLETDEPTPIPEEFLQWPIIQEELQNQLLDLVMPKPKAEFLLMGSAYHPNGLSEDAFTAKIEIANQHKQITIKGNREFKKGFFGYSLTDATAIESVKLSDENSFGGEGYQNNPLGCGVYADKKKVPLKAPNIEVYDKPFKSMNSKYPSEGFGSLPLTNDLRTQYYGDFKSQSWQEEHFPNLAPDMDFHYFQQARPDQWLKQYLIGDEHYKLTNLVPVVPEFNGQLPAVRARSFIQSKNQGFREIELNLDTLWLFPDISVGACIFHGQIEVEQLDSLDVEAHLLAFEHLKDECRSLDYYQKMLALRLDPETAAEAMFNESQLSPAKSAQQLQAEEQEIQDEIAQKKALQDEYKAQFLEDVKEQNNGEIPQGFEQPDMPEPNVVVAQKAIERGDFDGKKLMDDVKKQKEDAEKQRKEMEKELEEAQAIAEKTMKSADPEKLAELQAKDDVTEQVISMQQMAKNEALEIDEEQLKLIQENQFKAQQLSSEPLSDKPNTDEAQARRALFVTALENEESLHHRNWAGADLSGLVLDGLDFTGCNFKNCNFNNTSLKNANLTEAALLGSVIRNSSFASAILKEANFSSVVGYGNDFTACDLQKALFVKTNLRNCCFKSATFCTAIFSEASIVKSFFSHANINTLCINNSNMSDNDFDHSHGEMFVSFNVDFRFTRFCGSQLTRSAFLDTNLSVASFADTQLDRCQFSGQTLMTSANFTQSVAEQCGLRRVSAEHLQAAGAQFTMCDLGDSDLHASNLRSARFIQCVLSESRLHDCKLEQSTFYGSLLRQTQLLRCTLNDSNFYQADVVLAYVYQSNYAEANNVAPLALRRWRDADRNAA